MPTEGRFSKFVDFKDKFNEKFSWKRVLNNNSIFVSCFTFQYWQKKIVFCSIRHVLTLPLNSYQIRKHAHHIHRLVEVLLFCFFCCCCCCFLLFFLHVYPFRFLSHSITPSLLHEFASFASLVIFIGGVLTYFAVSLCFTLFILVVAEIILSHVQCASSSLSHTHWVLMCVFVLSLSWHRQRHR